MNVNLNSRPRSGPKKSRSTTKKFFLSVSLLIKLVLLLSGFLLLWNVVSLVNKRSTSSSSSLRNYSGDQKYHVVFSTSCSLKQDWQSYLFFFHAMIHNQPGDVTRIVSGCSQEQEISMRELHQKQFAIMNPNFLIHFTPEFGKQVEGFSFEQTKYWNKPFGLKHWLEHRFGYRYEGDISTEYDDDIVVLVDPDMLMQRPFINDFSKFSISIWNKYYREHPELLLDKVTQGHPAAQDYSFGEAWLTAASANLTYVVGPDSPVHHVTTKEARSVYAAGPPYWMTARDAYRIAYHWSDFLPRIFKLKPVFMAEMYGYCMAAAHLGLKHQMARGFMVSNVEMTEGEGWQFLEKADDTVCDVSQFKDTVPHVLHFCQRYSIGEYFINKHIFPTGLLTCDFPLVELPPLDILSKVNYSHYGDMTTELWAGNDREYYKRTRHAFMVCSLFPALNEAATFYKKHHCPNGANYDQKWNHFREKDEYMKVTP